MDRAWSSVEIKSIDEDKRIIRGIATTPSTDRVGDIVDPMGAEFSLPIPFLMDHGRNGSDDSIGHVFSAKPSKYGIEIEARVEKDPALPYLDAAWAKIKKKLVRGLSIGFKGIDIEPVKGGGLRFKRWSWLELSAVVIPANQEASISTIKSLDKQHLGAAIGILTAPGDITDALADRAKRMWDSNFGGGKLAGTADKQHLGAAIGAPISNPIVRLSSPGATGTTKTSVPKGKAMALTTGESIKAMQAERAAKVARMSAIMQKSIDEGVTLDEAEQQEYDGFATDIKSVDSHLVRLRDHEKLMIETASEVDKDLGTDPDKSKELREKSGGSRVLFAKSNLPKGTAFTRYAMAIAAAKGDSYKQLQIAQQHFKDTPEVELVLKAAIAEGTTSHADWAAPLVYAQDMASEFIDLLRPMTILGQIKGLRRVPFNIRMAKTASGTTSQWVGEGKAKPVTKMDFDTVSMTWAKIASIVVLTQELMRFSNPSAEAVVRQDMLDATAQFRDQQFIDPTVSAVANVSPASVTNGVTPVSSTGITFAQVSADVKSVMSNFTAASIFPRAGVWIMHPQTAFALSQVLLTGGDGFAFPNITMQGGNFYGFPVITSANVPFVTTGETIIVLMDASEILFAEDPSIRIDASDQASVQMDSAPTEPTGASTVLVSLWQRNLVGLRAEQYVNWLKRRSAAVQFISDVAY